MLVELGKPTPQQPVPSAPTIQKQPERIKVT